MRCSHDFNFSDSYHGLVWSRIICAKTLLSTNFVSMFLIPCDQVHFVTRLSQNHYQPFGMKFPSNPKETSEWSSLFLWRSNLLCDFHAFNKVKASMIGTWRYNSTSKFINCKITKPMFTQVNFTPNRTCTCQCSIWRVACYPLLTYAINLTSLMKFCQTKI